MFFAIKHVSNSFQMCATKIVAFVQILDRIYTPMKRRSFFQNLVSCNICQQDPSGGGSQILPVALIFTQLFCYFSAVLFVVISNADLPGLCAAAKMKRNFLFFHQDCVLYQYSEL